MQVPDVTMLAMCGVGDVGWISHCHMYCTWDGGEIAALQSFSGDTGGPAINPGKRQRLGIDVGHDNAGARTNIRGNDCAHACARADIHDTTARRTFRTLKLLGDPFGKAITIGTDTTGSAARWERGGQ